MHSRLSMLIISLQEYIFFAVYQNIAGKLHVSRIFYSGGGGSPKTFSCCERKSRNLSQRNYPHSHHHHHQLRKLIMSIT